MMPLALMVHNACDWLASDDLPQDVEEAHRLAYRRWNDARQAWYDEHGYPSIEAAIAVPDEPFDAEDLLGFACQPVSRNDLAEIESAMGSGEWPRP